MAEIAAGFVGPAIEVVKLIGAPIMRQFNYLCCFTSNISTLKLEAEKLDNAEGDLQGRVDRARDKVEIIAREVEAWLTESNDIKDIKNTILHEVPNVESGCLKLGARFSLSKRAKKTIDLIIELRGQCKFDAVSQPRLPGAAEGVPLEMRTYEFKSRKQIEEDIMTSLRDGDVNMMGISGILGGLGKTTMAKMIMNRALKDQLFDEVVMAVVTQPVDKLKIQLEIGGPLGLKNLKEETSMANRVQMLHTRLTGGTKRILLVLDDVWEKLVVEELGIPRGSKGCTILLTSRNSDVLRAMDVQKDFGMKVLSEEDAWLLFRGRAGTCVDDTGLNSIAKEVVEECRGLPIALTTVGAALKDENDKRIWKYALQQLRKASPNNISDFIKEVYNPLRVSYDMLESQQAKSVFLLCCLFGEDDDIRVEHLIYFCMGLGIFEGGINNLEEARNRMSALIKRLKSRSLLLDSDEEDCVQMHDVIRDVCIFIAKEKRYIGANDCTWISSFQTTIGERIKLPTNLRLLFLSSDSKLEEEIKFDNTFVEGIRDLHVLLIHNHSLTSLPLYSLRNLRTLMLYSCQELKIISVVGDLVHLEILICRNCYSIKELPPEMKRLNRLKLLDLTGCRNLQRIEGGIISSLVGLEELKMLESFKKWEAARDRKKRGDGNATVRELEALTNLRSLEMEIEDPALAVESMRLSSMLDRFQIRIPSSSHIASHFSYHTCDKKMSLEWDGETHLGDWIEYQLLRDTECLYLTGNGAKNLDLTKSQNIRCLILRNCEKMKNFVRTSMDDDGRYSDATMFPHMEFLHLFSLPKLQQIWDGPISSNSFQNLQGLRLEFLPALKHLWQGRSSPSEMSIVSIFSKLSSLHIYGCHGLWSLFSLPVTEMDICLLQLEELVIESCDRMEHVFSLLNEGENRSNIIHIPNLKVLILDSLPELTCFCRGTENFEFPLLRRKRISRCPQLENFVITDHWSPYDHDDNIHLFCEPDNKEKMELKLQRNITSGRNKIQECVEYMSLEADGSTSLDFGVGKSMRCLTFRECSMGTKLMNMTTIATLFPCIKVLTFRDCLMEMKLMNMMTIATPFPLLEVLCLVNIKDLEEIWDIDGLKNLNELRLKSLPKLKHLWQSSSSPSQMNAVSIFSKLSSIYIHGCHELCNLFSLPVTNTGSCVLQLENLVIENCEMMEEVFLWNEEESQRNNIHIPLVFPKLKVLKLESLPRLTSFCEGMESFEFPLLARMRILGCPLLEILVSTDHSPIHDDHDSTHLVCKPDKKKIELWRNQLFGKVSYLSLEGDVYRNLDFQLAQNMRQLSFKQLSTEMKLVNVTTMDTLFPHLEVLRLINLTEIGEIWEFNGPLPSTSFENLKELRLEFLQAPKHLWLSSNSPYQMNVISIFNQLSSIYIYGCDGLCNLFSLSMMPRGSCLSQLERLEIEGCNEMNQVFLWNEEKNIRVEKFPKLKFLSLSFLPKLRNICKGIERIQCPLLDKVKIINCPLLQSIVYWDQELPFIFNSLRSSQLERGKGANTALQRQMLKREEKQQQKEVGEQSNLIRKTTTEDEDEEGRKGEIEEEQNWKTTTEKEGRKVEIEEEQNWKTTTKGGRKCEIEEEQN